MYKSIVAILTAKRKFYDLFIISLLAVSGFFYAFSFMHNYTGSQKFYQEIFAPAVLSACGKSFKDLSPSDPVPQLVNFLETKTQSFSCEYLPKTLKLIPLSRFQVDEYYLLRAVSLVWKTFGVSWPNLYILNALLFAIALIALYGILRLGMGNVFALFGVAVFVYFGHSQAFLPQLRDFCIVPFIFIFIYLFALLTRLPFKISTLLLITVAAGAVMGIGLGFRDDMFVYMPLFIITVLFFMPVELTKKLGIKLLAIAIYLALIVILVSPLYTKNKQTNNNFHLILLGLSNYVNFSLGVKNSPIYTMVYKYSDQFITSVMQAYAYTIYHVFPLVYMRGLYGNFTLLYSLEIFKNFPADIFIRTIASITNVIDITQHLHESTIFYILRFTSIAWTILGILVIRIFSLRLAIFVGLLVLFLGSYPVLQFEIRHVFYLLMIPIWILGFLAQSFVLYITSKQLRQSVTISWRSLAIFLMVPILSFGLIYYLAVTYQHYNLVKLFKHYEAAKLSPVRIKKITHKGLVSSIKLEPNITSGDIAKLGVKYGYLVAELDSKHCSYNPVMMQFQYEVSPGYNKNLGAYGYTLFTLVNVKGITKTFVPIYDTDFSHFSGVQIPTQQLGCIKKFYRVDNLAQYPLQLVVTLPKGWQKAKLHQKIGLEPLKNYFPKSIYAAPEGLVVPNNLWQLPITSPKLNIKSRIAKQVDNEIKVNGIAKSKWNFLATFAPHNFTAADLNRADYYFIAKGKRFHGGFKLGFITYKNKCFYNLGLIKHGNWCRYTFGLIKDKEWYPYSLVSIDGGENFKVVMKVTKPGFYQPTLTNSLTSSDYRNHFVITQYGWVKVNH